MHRADGSAKFFQGKTSVMACVYGPASTVTRKENAERAIVEVHYGLAAGLAGELQDLESLLRTATAASGALTCPWAAFVWILATGTSLTRTSCLHC